MALIVQKYGGTSVGTLKRIQRVARRIVDLKEQGNNVVVVVSAMGHTTDKLVEMAIALNKRPEEREMDMLLSTGEQVSIALLTMAIHALGQKAISLTGSQAGIRTDTVFSRGTIVEINNDRLRRHLDEEHIIIIAGFQGVDHEDEIHTLGRGGSDTTAVAIAAAIEADVCEILTDVDGVYTADPRYVPNARKLDEISHDEMLELASLGAKVLHPRAVEVAREHKVVLIVRSSLNKRPGTYVKEADKLEKRHVVSGVAADKDTAKISVVEAPDRPGIAALLFGALAESAINVDMIIQNVGRGNMNDISFTVGRDDAARAVDLVRSKLGEIGAHDVMVDDNIAKVSIVGAGMASHPGVAAKMFAALSSANINIQMISTSEIKVSCVIERGLADEAMRTLHAAFGLDKG